MTNQYWLKREGKVYGPYSGGKLKKLAREGKIGPSDLISTDKRAWQLAEMVRGLFSLTAAQQPQIASPDSDLQSHEMSPRTGAASGTHHQQMSSPGQERQLQPRSSRTMWVVIGVIGVAAVVLAVAIAVWPWVPPGESVAFDKDELTQSNENSQDKVHSPKKPDVTRTTPAPKVVAREESLSFWGFKLGSSYATCTRRMRSLKQEGILSKLSVGTAFGGDMPGSKVVSGTGNVDRKGRLTYKPNSLELYFSNGILKAVTLDYQFTNDYPRDLFDRQVADMERFLKTKAVVWVTEDDVGNRTRRAVIDKGQIRVRIESVLDGDWKGFASDIRISSRQVSKSDLAKQRKRDLAYQQEQGRPRVNPTAVPSARPALTKKPRFPFSLDEVDAAMGRPADTLGGWRRYAADGRIVFRAKQEGEGLTFWWSRNPQGMFFGAGFLGSDLFTSSERNELTALLDRSGVEQTIGRFVARTETVRGGITLYLLPLGAATSGKAIALKPNGATAHYKKGVTYLNLGQYKDAISAFKKAIAVNPDYAEAYYRMGLAYDEIGEYADAIIAGFAKAIAIKPDYTEAYVAAGKTHVTLGQYTLAILCYKKAIAVEPDNPVAYFSMAGAYAGLGRDTDAIAACKKSIVLEPDNPGAYFCMGLSYSAIGRHADAIVAFKRGLAFAPDDALAHCSMGGAYLNLKRNADALAAYKKAIVIDPDYADAYFGMGGAYVGLRDLANAIHAFEKFVVLEPKGKMADAARKAIRQMRGQ